jgi:peptide/nickel transport system permease protein
MFYLFVAFISLSFAWALPRYMPNSPIVGYMNAPPMGLTGNSRYQYLQTRDAILNEFGLRQPPIQQFVEFWGKILTGNYGRSLLSNTPVSELIKPYLWRTLSLVIPVLFLSFIIGNWIGGKSAYLKGKKSKLLYYIIIILQSAPFYWFALIFYIIFVAELQIFPAHVPSAIPPEHIPGVDPIKDMLIFLHQYLAPFFALLITQIGYWASGMRSLTLYEKDSEYLLYTQQLGFHPKVIRRYARRNALLPQATTLNISLNNLIGQTLIVEAIFGWPGLGLMNIEALSSQDFPLIVGGFMITLIVVIFGNFILDITYAFIDPRIRTKTREKQAILAK